MSYQVLARKYRPKTFREMVGQEHVLQALINALDHDRLHHAYLFTGTRGVGKTTIARILAKCLNCETGISSEPCGVCPTCQEIDQGRFVDLIEVDAASRTKVEDTRELLDNVQYAPTRGKYKVYLIDEVHMLSSHSFNALLKTLEEPPPHVKFLLATTDPQKLPVTILSRCLQFSLKNMPPQRIVEHLSNVLEKEMISFEEEALWELGRAADGSMRDAMSLTDQAIAFAGGKLEAEKVRVMLGTLDRALVQRLLTSLVSGNVETVMTVIDELADHAPDYMGVLADLISLLHRVALAQALPNYDDDSLGDLELIKEVASQLTAEDVQLYYQTALIGRKDLPFNPDQRAGLEMVLLRMMLFKPQGVLPPGSAPNRPGRGGGGGAANSRVGIGSTGSQRPSGPVGMAGEPGQASENVVQKERAMAQQQDGSPDMAKKSGLAAAKAALLDETKRPKSTRSPVTAVSNTNPKGQDNRPAQLANESTPLNPVSPHKIGSPKTTMSSAERSSQGSTQEEYARSQYKQDANPSPSVQTTDPQNNVVAHPAWQNAQDQTTNGGSNSAEDVAVASPKAENSSSNSPKKGRSSLPSYLTDQVTDPWFCLLQSLDISGGALNLARNCALLREGNASIHLALARHHDALRTPQAVQKLEKALSDAKQRPIRVELNVEAPQQPTPADILDQLRQQRMETARQSLLQDPFVQELQQLFNADLLADSVQPID